MIAPYAFRLFCLCLAAFFVINAVSGLASWLVSRFAMRFAEAMRPRSVARILFAARALPVVLGAGLVLVLCVPSYLRFEPESLRERMGWICLALALSGAAIWFLSAVRAVRAIAASIRCNREWRRGGHESRLPGETSRIVAVEKDAPLLAQTGVFRPRLVVSQSVLRALSPEQLDVALRHEHAHRTSRDNLKRLFLVLAPDPLPFLRAFLAFEWHWAKFSEWAADDEAVQGNSRRALSLAAALLRVARMGAAPRLSYLHTSLVAADHDFSARVDRLLRVAPACPRSSSRAHSLAIGAAFGTALCLAVLMPWHATLASVHRLLELLLR